MAAIGFYQRGLALEVEPQGSLAVNATLKLGPILSLALRPGVL
jgi:hypothetical protein